MEVALQAWCVFHAHDSDCDILKKRIVTVMTCSKIRECTYEPQHISESISSGSLQIEASKPHLHVQL
jgi:hypothetical protein